MKDKAEKQAAKEAEKERKQQEKDQAAEARSVIKNIGDAIKASMVICKRGGIWQVPPGGSGREIHGQGWYAEWGARGHDFLNDTWA